LAIPYIAIRIIEDIGSHDGGNLLQLPLVQLLHDYTVIVATTVLFVAHK
jgi:hypothetical protein